MTRADLLKIIWHSLYDPQQDTIHTIHKFFHQDYQQCINGVHMNLSEYIQHVIEQKKNMIIDTIDYQRMLEKDNELFAIYNPKGKNINNIPIEAEVIAYFRFEKQQLYTIHGQVRLIKGDMTDADM